MPSNGLSVMGVVQDAVRVDKLGEAYDLAIDIVSRSLKGDDLPATQVELARIVVAQWSKVRQTDNARAALNFMMSRQLAANREELGAMVVEVAPRDPIAGAVESRDRRRERNGAAA